MSLTDTVLTKEQPDPAAGQTAFAQETSGGNNAYHNFHNDFLRVQGPNERRRWPSPRSTRRRSAGTTASLLNVMLGIVYFPGVGVLPYSSDNAIKLATSAGTVVGQLVFGYLADHAGRKRMYGVEFIIIIFATLGQALSSSSPSVDVIGLIIFWRHPLSSIITSEFATTKWRGAMMGAVFTMHGIGQLVYALVMLFITLGFNEQLEAPTRPTNCNGYCAVAVDKMWRTLIGFCAVPAATALYYRLTIPETPRYTFDVNRDIAKAANDVEVCMSGKREGQPDDIERIQARRAAQQELQVLKTSWGTSRVSLTAPFDVEAFADRDALLVYSLSLNNASILETIGYSTKDATTTYEFLYNTALGNLMIVLTGAVPGYWVSGLLAIYVLAQFFFNFGPNMTTFAVPGEAFPTRYRSTSHGISAASGKIGSIIGQSAISTLRSRGATPDNPNRWVDHVLEIYALFMLLGCFTTLLIPETKRRTLEELSGEDQDFYSK
ncbi:hypothetical protein DL771_004029 [Monosporascus sp. 5C6A]|nr:hypothetical protein DL771_004029 [Monosporascus sp. 5C6A]